MTINDKSTYVHDMDINWSNFEDMLMQSIAAHE